jgi:hypothetical protein
LVASGPGRYYWRIPCWKINQLIRCVKGRQKFATHCHAWISANRVSHTNIHSVDTGWHVNPDETQSSGFKIADRLRTTIERDRRRLDRVTRKRKRAQFLRWHVNADVPDVRLMSGTLKEAFLT